MIKAGDSLKSGKGVGEIWLWEVVLQWNKNFYTNISMKRSALINDIENGGLNILHTECAISEQRLMALEKYFGDGNRWKVILDQLLCNVGRKFILFCDFDTRKFPAHFSVYYKEVSFPMRMLSTKSFGITTILLSTNNRFSKNICFVRELSKLGTCYLTRTNFFKVRRYW